MQYWQGRGKDMLYGVVLAGGRSSRMQQDKRALELGGQTLLQRAVALLRAAGTDPVLISGMDESAARAGDSAFPDLLPHCGPPGGVYSALHFIREHYGLDSSDVLFIPVDMPLLAVPTLEKLITASVNVSGCQYAGEVFPCILRATHDLYTHLHDLFAEGTELGGRRSMKAIMHYVDSKQVDPSGITPDEFMNVNTPEDFSKVRALLGS
jgi:molybdopterin-guanine dinucleotide biosynthesis protein A